MTWDYVIVGGGSAGCVLANRLTGAGWNVLLLEAGKTDRSPYIHVPGWGMKALARPGMLWGYRDEPDPTRNHQTMPWMAGRVLGGGSSVNGMVWVRGNRADYDRWAAQGCAGWDYDSVLPYFKRAERFEGGDETYRGWSGPQWVSFEPMSHELTDAFIAGAQEIGHRFSPDYNGAEQEGVAVGQANLRWGFRHSAARAYLGPARRRRNLEVLTEATARRILFDGRRAVGVEYERGGQRLEARAGREVVLCAGSLASPVILLRSGVGPPATLQRHGVAVVADNPGVGFNLQEHPVVLMLWNVSVNTLNLELNPRGYLRHGPGFVLRGRGPAACSFFHAVDFFKLDPGRQETEVEIGFAPMGAVGVGAESSDTGMTLQSPGEHDVSQMELLGRPCVSAYVALLHPRSRGSVELRSADPVDAPVIRHQFFADERDLHDLVAACRATRPIFETTAMGRYVVGEALPGERVKSDEEWEGFLRMATWGAQHPLGTCKMGVDAQAVVDPQLRVRAVAGLRVVDASVMPDAPSGNTNAPTIMVAEKASDLILSG
jgi:choline dehydrogenase